MGLWNSVKGLFQAAPAQEPISSTRPINEDGMALIRRWEGLRLKAYKDTAGVPTIGYGHTRGVKMGMTCTAAEANEWLKEDVKEAASIVDRWVKVPITHNQRAALTSFVYNCGPGQKGKDDGLVWLKNGNHSTLLNKLNNADYGGALAEFPKWSRDITGKTLAGLAARRRAEAALFAKTP